MLSSTLLASIFIATTSAHSWIEQMQLISANGSYAGDAGYPRGYIARTDPGFNGYSDKWQLPSPDYDLGRTRINETDHLCHPAQRTANYTSQYPKLKAAPDSYVALRYLENGHVTQPWIPAGKPAGSGTVFIYGTYSPSADEKITDVLQWNTAGNGGDGKGFLITAQDFDDGRCHQLNQSPISVDRQMHTDAVPGQESWCETDLHIPSDGKTGSTLTIYWIWSWQTSTQTEGAPCGKDEYYTTCADIDIVDKSQDLYSQPKAHTIVQQDPQSLAPSDYQSRSAVMATPNLVTTEDCSITSITYSSLPASETQPTTLPANFMQTFSKGPPQQAQQIPLHSTSPISSAALIRSSAALLSSAPTIAIQSPAVNQNQITVTVFNPPQTTVYVTASASPTPHQAAVVENTQGMIGEKLENIKIKARKHGRQFVEMLEKKVVDAGH